MYMYTALYTHTVHTCTCTCVHMQWTFALRSVDGVKLWVDILLEVEGGNGDHLLDGLLQVDLPGHVARRRHVQHHQRRVQPTQDAVPGQLAQQARIHLTVVLGDRQTGQPHQWALPWGVRNGAFVVLVVQHHKHKIGARDGRMLLRFAPFPQKCIGLRCTSRGINYM